jgi:hypothetical protein
MAKKTGRPPRGPTLSTDRGPSCRLRDLCIPKLVFAGAARKVNEVPIARLGHNMPAVALRAGQLDFLVHVGHVAEAGSLGLFPRTRTTNTPIKNEPLISANHS